MGFTPNEIRNQEFSKSFRGFSPTEVEAFKEAAATALEEAKVEILKLSEERESFKSRYEELKSVEDTLKNVVVEAQKNADKLLENARKEAELIVSEAHQKRDRAIEEKQHRITELDSRVHEIEFTRRSFYSRLKAEIEAHLKLMEQVYIPRRQKMEERLGEEKAPEITTQTPEQQPNETQNPPAETENPQSPQPVNAGEHTGEHHEGDDIDRIVDQFRNENENKEE